MQDIQRGQQNILISIIVVICMLLVLWGLRVFMREEAEENNILPVDNDGIVQVQATAEEIRDQDGNVIVSADNVLGTIEVSRGSDFGVDGPFTDAQLSPNREWIAFTMMGAAHGSGWAYEVQTEEMRPVSFQFGGTVVLESWSDDSQYIAFIQETPGPHDTIHIVNIQEIRRFPDETGFSVESPAEEEFASISDVEWKEEWLCFTVEKRRYCIDPKEEELVDRG